jgi:putative transposase
VKWHRPLPVNARLGAAVLSRSCGRWFVCFQVELPDAGTTATLPHRQGFAPVGIDLGLSALVALSTGETIPTPPITKNLDQLTPPLLLQRAA